MRIKNVKLIDGSDIEAFVLENYGRRWSIAAAHELGNDSMIERTVPGESLSIDDATVEDWLAVEAPEGLESYKRDSWYEIHSPWIDVQEFLNDMHERGLIPEGEYVVKVWW